MTSLKDTRRTNVVVITVFLLTVFILCCALVCCVDLGNSTTFAVHLGDTIVQMYCISIFYRFVRTEIEIRFS